MRFVDVFSCVRVLAESVASLPCKVYMYGEDGRKEVARSHPNHRILGLRPNPEMTGYTFWETAVGHIASWGNFYGYIKRLESGYIDSIWPLKPPNVRPFRGLSGKIEYEVKSDNGGHVVFPNENVLHIPGLGFDGLMGYSVISQLADSIGLAMGGEQYAAKFFSNDGTPGGVVETDKKMTTDTIALLRKNWQDMYGGASNSHKIAVLEQGMKFNPITINPEDAQLIEQRKFSRSQIAEIFRVPAHMINDLEKATFSNIEHQDLAFAKHTLRPWCTRIEQSVMTQMFTDRELAEGYFVKFNMDALMRGDYKSRQEGYEIATRSGIMLINEARALEDLPPVGGGDTPIVQGQMISLEQAITNVKGGVDENGGQGTGEESNN